MSEPASDLAPEGTRLALIDAGLTHFGQQGFAATSTRQLAATAKTNVASIAYHFGGKDGLRQACAEELMRRIGTVLAGATPMQAPGSPAEARIFLQILLERMVAYMVGGVEAGNLVPFMLRELTEGGAALDTIYRRMIDPTHRRLCVLCGVATGQDPDSEAVKLTVFSLIGQVLYFRIGHRIVAKRMDWPSIGPDEAKRVARTLLQNLDAILGAKVQP
jgi:AcrR family transcriptional regulator